MKRYVVCLVFAADLQQLFLLRRKQPPFAGLLNGFGGKVEPGETVLAAVSRELEEETGLQPIDLSKLHNLMTITYPVAPTEVELAVFYAIVKEGLAPHDRSEREGTIVQLSISADWLAANNPSLAGEGNLAYFLNLALLLEGVATATIS